MEHFTLKDPPMYQIDAMFQLRDWWKRFDIYICIEETIRVHASFVKTVIGCLIPVVCIFLMGGYIISLEPRELYMERDEFWDHWEWWYYGLEIEPKKYEQDLEVRRAKKWRNIPYGDWKFGTSKNAHIGQWSLED
eukprot:GHVL01025114.1.p1 GENE.GHVL01025114.1~~GHVL01025114.1.p1  ORF type:complete len:135 (+),score=33.88 GHVL01025114.1:364-768(+)